ncbi:hypothetical protein K7X08_016160 [Anisodus acutangulus]|uniref:RNase III domain-containing protein n=1 Tax=Anisodus acutangulus TaxID=402998 RepID=A0A9Q1LEP5_9SOLA|nr:hypothetical protein K7X08_016160 [Anisodus acutangulus]
MEFYGGVLKAPKVLADIVESVMDAVYLDCGFDVNALWVIFRGLLEPIIMLNVLEEQPQPVTMLLGLSKKDGKQVDVEHRKEGDKNKASVYLDGQFIASGSSEHKENANLQVAKTALKELFYNPYDKMDIEKEIGPAHDRRFICSVQIAIAEGMLFVTGDEKSRVKDAENSAALAMIRGLQESKFS